MRLSPARETFAQEYSRSGNASEAYRRAFPRSAKWRPESVNTAASRLLANAKVAPRILDLRKRTEQQSEWSRARWIEELTAVFRTAPVGSKLRLETLIEIGKALGYYDPVKVQVDRGPSMQIIVLPPDAEERAEIEARAKAIEAESRAIEAPARRDEHKQNG